MNGVSASSHVCRGLPATTILQLSSQRKLVADSGPMAACETLLAAVKYPPRGGEPRSLAALVPEVLSRYGLAKESPAKPVVDLVA
jgi:hypothetical protein